MAEGLVLVADSSAWILALRPPDSITKRRLIEAVRNHTVLMPDLVLVEVMRGARTEREAKTMLTELGKLASVEVVGREMALRAAENYRHLRSKGITIRGTVDLLIATWCIENNVALLHGDRDFDGFEKHLGLHVWRGDDPLPDLA